LKARVVSNSLTVRIRLVIAKEFLTMLPGSMLHFGAKRLPVKALPVTLPMKSQPIEIVMLKNRTLVPVAESFIECLHTVAKPLKSNGGGPPDLKAGPASRWLFDDRIRDE
jgi:DNA-binding transcriptional LysR family regulator